MNIPIKKRRLTIATTYCLKTRCLVAGVALMGLYSQQGLAFDCRPRTASITLDLGNIDLKKDIANLTNLSPIIDSIETGHNCLADASYTLSGVKAYGADTGQKIGVIKIFASNVSGVGFTMAARESNQSFYATWIGQSYGYPPRFNDAVLVAGRGPIMPPGSPPEGYNYRMTASIQLYKTGDIGSGTLSGKIGALIAYHNANPPRWATEIPIYITGTITKATCSLTNTSISVPLGDISATNFSSIGATFSEKKFNVDLNCDPEIKVSVSLSGTQSTETTDTSVLALTGAGQSGVVSGLGVQILSDGTLLKRGTNLLVKTVAGGKESLQFSARYYQTKKDVTVGKANTAATLNFTYQ